MATTIASPFGVAGLNESGPRPYLFAVTETMARHAGGGIVIVLSAMALWLGLPDLAADARIALIAFVGALVGWTVMKLPDASVAIAAAVALVLTGTVNDRALFDTLGEDLVWLLIASFVMAAVLRRSGVAERLARRLLCRIGRVDRLLTVTTLFIFATAFLIPSTSARAAMLLPVFVALSTAIRRPARQFHFRCGLCTLRRREGNQLTPLARRLIFRRTPEHLSQESPRPGFGHHGGGTVN